MTEAERRKQARERRRRVRERTGTPEPAEHRDILVDPQPLLVAGCDTGVYEPLLVPNRELKDTQGRYPYRALVMRLKEALALNVLVAFHGLQAALGTRVAAENKLNQLGLPSLKNLLRDGRALLRHATLFDSEKDLQRWSIQKVEAYRHSNGGLPRSNSSPFVLAELSAVKIVQVAQLRAQSLLSVFEDVQRRDFSSGKRGAEKVDHLSEDDVAYIDQTSHDEIQAAFDRHPASPHPGELWELAFYADVNPVVLWPQHIRLYAQLFEVARFLGRADRGVEARLDNSHLPIVATIVRETYGPFDDDRDLLAQLKRIKLNKHFSDAYFSQDELLDYLDCAHHSQADLVVEARTRRLIIERRPSA